MQLGVSTEKGSDAGDGSHPRGGQPRTQLGAGRRHSGLLRKHRPWEAHGAGEGADLGQAGTETDRPVAGSGCDGRWDGEGDACGNAAGRSDLAALSNIYLGYLDRIWENRCKHLGILVRYADDFVMLCKSESQCKEALRRVKIVMERLGLEMHPEKTRMVNLAGGKEGFTFLGWTVRKRRSIQRNPRKHFVQRWPSPKAMKRIRDRVHELTEVRGRQSQDMGELIEKLNPVLRGWGNYFRTGNADTQFTGIDDYV